ncbi:hypothetical protein BCR44DRAFT_315985 [Catenaria anguillulae PL171]|uniref:Uncharacterized protein n=1 Tax=Catenaria anguillulae PL171 TaxID=765915 RepID=A0A1Y2HXR4_9FUNG|nr:hypothetical protein BCR44DRAFT_315985 [Catenaria anguillulae PL171]
MCFILSSLPGLSPVILAAPCAAVCAESAKTRVLKCWSTRLWIFRWPVEPKSLSRSSNRLNGSRRAWKRVQRLHPLPSNSSLLWLLLGSLIHDTIKAAFALYQREALIRVSFLLAAQESPFLRVTEKQSQYGGTLPNGISNVAVSLAFLLQPLPTLQRRGMWGGKSTMRVGMRSRKASTFSVPGGLRLQPPAASGSTPRERLFLTPKSAADSSRFLAAGSGDDEMAASPKFSRSRFQSLHATPVASTSLFRTIATGAGTSNAKSDALLATSSLAFPPLPKTLDREVAPSTHMPLPRPSVSDPVPVTVTQFSDLLAQIPTNIIDPASLDPSDVPIEPAKARISKKLRNIANSIYLFVLSQLALVSYQFPTAEQELAYHAFYLRNLLGRIRVTLALSVISSGLSFSLLAVIRTSMSGFSTSTASWWLNQWIAGSDGRDTLVSVGVLLVVLAVPQLPWTRTLPSSRRRWIELVAVLYAIAIMSLAKTSDIVVHQARSATADRAGIQITNHRVVHSLFTLTTLRLRPKVHLSILAGAFIAAVIELGVFWNSPVLGERARVHSIVAIGTIMGSVTLCLLFEISSRKYFWLKEVVGQGNGTLDTSHRAPIDVENE